MMEQLHRDMGRVEAEQVSVRRELENLRAEFRELHAKVDHLVKAIDQAKGGWKALVAAGAVAAGLTAAAAKMLGWFGMGR